MVSRCYGCKSQYRLTMVDGKLFCPQCEWEYSAWKHGLIKQPQFVILKAV